MLLNFSPKLSIKRQSCLRMMTISSNLSSMEQNSMVLLNFVKQHPKHLKHIWESAEVLDTLLTRSTNGLLSSRLMLIAKLIGRNIIKYCSTKLDSSNIEIVKFSKINKIVQIMQVVAKLSIFIHPCVKVLSTLDLFEKTRCQIYSF